LILPQFQMTLPKKRTSRPLSSTPSIMLSLTVNLFFTLNGTTILAICKQAGRATLTFKSQIQVVRRPYIIYASDLESVCHLVQQILDKLRDTVSTAFPVLPPELHQSLEICNNQFDKAEETIKQFSIWLKSNMNSYVLPAEPSLLEATKPLDIETARTDMRRCPRWILRQLYESRQAWAELLQSPTVPKLPKVEPQPPKAEPQLQMSQSQPALKSQHENHKKKRRNGLL